MTTTKTYTAEDFYTEPYPGRKGEDLIREGCGKCMGTGSVSWGINVSARLHNVQTGRIRDVPKVCFDCHGTGTYTFKVKSARARIRRAAKEQAKLANQQVQAEADKAEFAATHGEVLQTLETLTGSFGESLRSQFESVGKLTEGQILAVQKIAAEQAAQPEAAPVVEGRIVLTGKVLSVKLHENEWGSSIKMVLLDDRGFKVWGTVPRQLEDWAYTQVDDETRYCPKSDDWYGHANYLKGERVTFTATVTKSDKDETFGFYKRPVKAEVL